MCLNKFLTVGIPVSCAGIVVWWAIRKYRQPKTDESSNDYVGGLNSHSSTKSEPCRRLTAEDIIKDEVGCDERCSPASAENEAIAEVTDKRTLIESSKDASCEKPTQEQLLAACENVLLTAEEIVKDEVGCDERCSPASVENETKSEIIDKKNLIESSKDASSEESTQEQLLAAEHKKLILMSGAEKFNEKPTKGIQFLQEEGLLSTPEKQLEKCFKKQMVPKKQLNKRLKQDIRLSICQFDAVTARKGSRKLPQESQPDRTWPFQPPVAPFQPEAASFQQCAAPFQSSIGPIQPQAAPFQPHLPPLQPSVGYFEPRPAPFQPHMVPFHPYAEHSQSFITPFQTQLAPFQTHAVPFGPGADPVPPHMAPFQPQATSFKPRLENFQPRAAPFQPHHPNFGR